MVIARHAYGDIYQAQEIEIKKKGKLFLKYESEDKKSVIEKEVFHFQSEGVGLSYFNSRKSIEDFAYSCFNFGLIRKCLYFYLLKTLFFKVMMRVLSKYLIQYTMKITKLNMKILVFSINID